VRRRGWREPALFALVVLLVSAVNASSLVLVGVGPVLWVLALVLEDRELRGRVLGAVGRIGLLSFGVSLWWIAALRLEAAYGLPVLQVTERLETVAETSSPLDVLRGLGNWFFYGKDRLGYSIDQAADYLTSRPTIALSFAIPAIGLAAALATRWRHRARFLLLLLAGTVLSVGAWPTSDPSPFAAAMGVFTEETSAGLALRNTARAVPLVILALAALIAAAVDAWRPHRRRVAATALVSVVAAGGLLPVWQMGYLSEGINRDPVPDYWYAAAEALDASGSSTRVLEIPGSPFGGYRWGNTVDPILPGLMDRPHVAREVLPLGSVESALLIDALDRRLQEGTFEPAMLAPVARLLSAGTVVLRSDLQYERFLTPRPRMLWDTLTAMAVPGLEDPVGFGEPRPNVAIDRLPMLDELAFRTPPDAEDPPPVATFEVEDPAAIIRTAPVTQPVVLAGDGDGIVDAAAAGLVDGKSLLLYLADLDEAELDAALNAGADLVLTDTNRRRIQTWFYAIRDTRGPTERPGETFDEPTGYDNRLELFPDANDDSRTVTEPVLPGVFGDAGGGASRPEDRVTSAADGDLRTAWRIGGADPTGARILLDAGSPVRTDHLTFIQPQDGPRDRVIDRIRITLDGGDPFDVELGEASWNRDGQVVTFPEQEVQRVEIELTSVTVPTFDPAGANAVGFAEVRLGDVIVEELVRLPLDLLRRTAGADGHRLDVVLTRLRTETAKGGRIDPELDLRRTFSLPVARSFRLQGVLRVNPNAKGPVLDEVLGTTVTGGIAESAEHVAADLGSRPSRAFDGDPKTAWQSPFGPSKERWVGVVLDRPKPVGELTVHFLADGLHSVPTRLRLEADDAPPVLVDVPAVADGPAGTTASVTLPAPAGPAQTVRVFVDDYRPVQPAPEDPDPGTILPVGITEITGTGMPHATDSVDLPRTCRPLLEVDGVTVQLRAVGTVADARRGVPFEICGDDEVDFVVGQHNIRSKKGLDTGIDLDRLVLSSAADGTPGEVGSRGAPRSSAGTSVTGVDDGRVSADVTLETDGEPFWLELGQSSNPGWEIEVSGATVGPRRVVDGYANGWLIQPDEAGTLEVHLRWAPQRLVWVTLVISALAALVCLALVLRGRRGPPLAVAAGSGWAIPGAQPVPLARRPAVPIAAGALLAGLVATPLAALVLAGAAVVGLRQPRVRWAWIAVAPALLYLGRAADMPELAWLSLALVAGDQIARWCAEPISPGPPSSAP
jgi:arabinofuranan 3-O-arabinosyltransferase